MAADLPSRRQAHLDHEGGLVDDGHEPLCNRSLEDLVPADHVYRQLEARLDLTLVRDMVRSTCQECGRPSIDPKVFFKLQLACSSKAPVS